MFVRIVWSSKAVQPYPPRAWRAIRSQPRLAIDDLGIPAPDFAKMTKGLFGRPE
ncbi:hypothetical protein [Pelagibacterium sediminicola]|uniref:hypothetical protein n=1 Tax=Pelagibacterium sediminicola TaxID=2248761 RepID=UPI001300B600|nr:hypothetical protein [Pelagibacterium sediminicola]